MSKNKFAQWYTNQLRLPYVDSRELLPDERSESPDEMLLFGALHAAGWGTGSLGAANDNAIGLPNRVKYLHPRYPNFVLYQQVELLEAIPEKWLPQHRADLLFYNVYEDGCHLMVSVETALTHGDPKTYAKDRELDRAILRDGRKLLEVYRANGRTFRLPESSRQRGLQTAVSTIHSVLFRLSA